MNKISFTETLSKLHGKVLVATIEEVGTFKIETCMFTRNSYNVSFRCAKSSHQMLGQYIGDLDSAKRLCEAKLQQVKTP